MLLFMKHVWNMCICFSIVIWELVNRQIWSSGSYGTDYFFCFFSKFIYCKQRNSIIKVINQITAIAICAFLFVKKTLCFKGFKTNIALSSAIRVKWNIDARINVRYKTWNVSNISSKRQGLDKSIDDTIVFDNRNIQSDTDKLSSMTSYIFFFFSLVIMTISMKFNIETANPIVKDIIRPIFSVLWQVSLIAWLYDDMFGDEGIFSRSSFLRKSHTSWVTLFLSSQSLSPALSPQPPVPKPFTFWQLPPLLLIGSTISNFLVTQFFTIPALAMLALITFQIYNHLLFKNHFLFEIQIPKVLMNFWY